MEWKVGQQVYCLRFGEGVITAIEENVRFPLKVKFNDGEYTRYLLNGFFYECDATPMLYPSKPEITVPKWQPKEGEWCWFWDQKFTAAMLAKFEKMDENNNYVDHDYVSWDFCAPFNGELPEHLKEVQP